MASEEESQSILEDYKSSLNDLVFNSKPLINVLTMLAEENEAHADGIVKVIRDRVKSVGIKLKMPSLYLLDSILKNVGGDFINILSNYMIDIFTDVFDEGDEKVRMSLYKLRNTWPQYFPSKFLYELDLSVKELDPNWPVTDPPSSVSSIHVNPKFLVQSEKKEKLASSDESIHIANLKAKEKEEKLKAEERKIKEQLKKLQEEQLKLQQSRLEEERLKQEELLRKQQEDRERLIKEQQKQLLTLRMQQEKDLRMKNLSTAMTSLSPKKTVLPESKKNIDPRLAKREMMTNAKEMIKSIPSSSEPIAVKLLPRKDVTPSHMQDLRETLTQRHQDRSSKANLIASSKTQKESRLPLEGNNNTSKLTPSLPLDKLVSKSTTFIHTTVNRDHEELTNEPQTNPDLAVKSESSVEPKAVKRLVLSEDERLVVVVSDDRGNANGNKQLSDVQESVDAPPVKKRKSDEPIKSVVLSMDFEEDDYQTAVTASETPSGKATEEKPVEKDAENTSPTSSEIDPSYRFRKRNRSEWRKLMIEKAKLERRKRIPSEKELPRAMRVENHEELVNKLKARLSTGEIKEKEYASLVKQLDLMYEVQRTRETPEKKRELAENQREKGSDSVDIKDRLGQAKDIGSSPSKVGKTDTIQQTGKALSQKETNQDLIRQLREKRINAEKEQRENEWRLKRDWNIDQLRVGRDRRDRDRDRRDRDGDSRVRRGFENRTDRRDRGYEPDVRDARDRRRNRGRDRDRLLNERADYSRSRFNRDRDNRERREQSPPRDRRHSRLDEPSYRRGGRNVESRSRLPVESNEKDDKDDNIPADSSKGQQDDAEKEKGNAAPAPAVEVQEQKDKGKGSGDAVTEQGDIGLESVVKEQPSKETDETSSSLENDNTSCEPAMKDSAPENTASAEAKGDIVTSEASAPTEEEERDSLKGDIEKDSHEDHTKTVMNPKERKPFSKEKKGIESFRIPKKERPVDGRPIEEKSVSQKPYPVDLSRDVDDRSANQLPVDLPLDDDVRMLSWRHQEGDNHPMDGRRDRFHGDRDVMVPRRQQFGSRHDRRMFPEDRRGTPPYIDHDLEPGPDGHRSFPPNERSLSWRERHDPEFRPGLHPDFDRRPGFLDRPRPGEDPDFRPGFRDEDVDFPDRFPLRQGREGDHRKMSPMHQPDAPMLLRPDIDDMYHPGPPISGPRYREPQNHGPRFREPRIEGPRMAGPGNDFGHFREPGYTEMEEDHILRREFRGPRFGPSDLPFEEMDRNLGPDERFLPPDSHRHLEGPIERRPEYFGDREPSSIDYRHGLREPWRGDHPDSFRHSPFDENRLDREDRQRFEERRQYTMEVDRPMPYQPGPPGNSGHLDPQQRRYMHPDQGGEGFRPMPHEYQERRSSPVIFDYAHGPPDQFMRASEPYSIPPSAGFTTSNPLMKMIENVKRSAGEPTHVDQVQKPPQAPQSFIGVNELFHKLVSTGVIATQDAPGAAQKSATPPPRLETQEESIPEINFVMEDLKKRHLSIINTLYLGSQCSSCGLRYPEEEKQLYRDHLDWHFRVNRREKENKKSISRPWFYSVEQWCDMDDVFDIEEAAKSNVFENEAKREETSTVETGDGSCSVLQGQDDSYCNICFDPFEQFWDEALEEWRYKDAVRVKGKTYHRNCYDDMESGGYLSENDEEIQSEEEKFSPVAFSEFLKPERSEPIWKSEEESSVVSPVKFWTISVKTDPEDVRMDADDDSRNSVFKIDVNKVAVKTEPDQPVAVKSEPEDVEMFEEVNQRISMGNSENNFYKVSVKSEPLEPVSVKTEPVDSNIVDRESATASLPASEKGTEQSSLTKDPSDLMDPPVETEHQTTRSAADMAPVLSEQAGDALEKDITVSDGAPGEIKVASQSSSEEAIVKGKEDLLPGSHPVDEAKRTVTVTETTSAIAQDVVMDSAVSGNADERTASCALESSDTSAILNPERKTEDVSVCGTEKTEIGESSAEMVTNNVTSAQEDVEKDVEPKKLSEQFQAENIDEIIFEPLTENKEMKNLDEIIESEGKPQSS